MPLDDRHTLQNNTVSSHTLTCMWYMAVVEVGVCFKKGVGTYLSHAAAEWPLRTAHHDEGADTFQRFNNKWTDKQRWQRGVDSVDKCNRRLF